MFPEVVAGNVSFPQSGSVTPNAAQPFGIQGGDRTPKIVSVQRALVLPGTQPAGQATEPIAPFSVAGNVTVAGDPQAIETGVGTHCPHVGSDIALNVCAGVHEVLQLAF
jgi:hypothetical protein